MRLIFDIVIAVVIATAVGFLTAWYAIDHGPMFGAVHVGSWVAYPNAGGQTADPYAIATLARTGEIPLGAGEGISFAADEDDTGSPLSGNCTYRIVGQTPAARLWTLTVYTADGHLMTNAAHRFGFSSRDLLRHPDGTFEISVAPEVHSGNWLPTAGSDRFKMILRLYDTPVTTGSRIAELTMPAIERGRCT